jgi:hypothetical protein
MEPYYSIGDYVGGIVNSEKNIAKYDKLNCIVQLENGDQLIRRIIKDKKEDLFTLFCINPTTTVSTPIIFDQKIIRVAPIIWHRKKIT